MMTSTECALEIYHFPIAMCTCTYAEEKNNLPIQVTYMGIAYSYHETFKQKIREICGF